MRKLLLSALLVAAALPWTACRSLPDGPVEDGDAFTRVELGGVGNANEWDGLLMGGQPSAEDLDLARRRGVTRVLNVRRADELTGLGFDEGALCAELGMDYVQVGINWMTMTDAQFDTVLEILDQPTEGSTLFHCASGNRVSVFVAAWRITRGLADYDRAVADARAAGMKPQSKDVLDEQLRRLGAL